MDMDSLVQRRGQANYGPGAKSDLSLVFVKKVSLEHRQPYSCSHSLCLCLFLHCTAELNSFERPYGTQSPCLSPGHLQEMFADTWLRKNFAINGIKYPSLENSQACLCILPCQNSLGATSSRRSKARGTQCSSTATSRATCFLRLLGLRGAGHPWPLLIFIYPSSASMLLCLPFLLFLFFLSLSLGLGYWTLGQGSQLFMYCPKLEKKRIKM